MGLSLLGVLLFYITGGLFSPIIGLPPLLVGVIKPIQFVLYYIVQMGGAVVAAALTLGELVSKYIYVARFSSLLPFLVYVQFSFLIVLF